MSCALPILLPLSVDHPFTYLAEDEFPQGTFVRVPFRNSSMVGIVWKETEFEDIPPEKLKTITHILPLPPLSNVLQDFIKWVASYSMAPVGAVLRLVLSEKSVFNPPKRSSHPLTPDPSFPPPSSQPALSNIQKAAVLKLNEGFGTFRPFLLDGVTGSGKTEVYTATLSHLLKEAPQAQALILLPEIALTPQTLSRIEERLGQPVGAWHSTLTPAQRRKVWADVLIGKTPIVIGTRSALFLPFSHLQLIVVDEEHDSTYKQEEGTCYHARDMAVVRAKLENCPIILSTATPSLESWYNCQRGTYTHVPLQSRAGEAQIPSLELVDMRAQNMHILSKDLRNRGSPDQVAYLSFPIRVALETTLAAGQQSLLFLNRRGFAPLTLCRACGYRFKCPNCSAWQVSHRKGTSLLCHHCGFNQEMPVSCPECGAEGTFGICGPGVERIAQEVETLFPTARVLQLSSDVMTTSKKLDETLDQIRNHTVDILIGTQIVAKGHNFPNLAFVGVVDGDMGLSGGDPRALERTYQMLTQVGGRSGRHKDILGRVLIQTHTPEHPVFASLLAQDREGFFQAELKERQAFGLPPFGRLSAIIISSTNPVNAEQTSKHIASLIPKADGIHVLGPAPAPLYQLRSRYRWRFLIKSQGRPVQDFLKTWLRRAPLLPGVDLKIDIDPISFL